jgi:D-alanyl-D-alanine carboxypeptidase
VQASDFFKETSMTTTSILRVLSLCAIQVALSLSLVAHQEGQAGDPEKLVRAYVAAFNGGEEAMRGFMTENFSKTALGQMSVDMRLSVYRQLRTDMESISLNSIEDANSTAVSALMHTKKDEWFLFTFRLEEEPPHNIIGIRVEDTVPPDSSSRSPLSEKEALREVAQYLEHESKMDAFSGAVLLARDEQAIWKKAYGMASKEFQVPNRPDTKFNLGSINKIFTQISIGQLYEDGKLSMADPIQKFIPEYPNTRAAQKVTIRHLLDMSSGIGDFFGEKFEKTPKDLFRKNSDFLQIFAGDSLMFEPGTKRQYSNGGYVVLGAIIEKTSGQNYYEYVRDHIFRPAGMMSTESYQADESVPNLAEGYTHEGFEKNEWRKNIYSRPARGSSAGGGYSTAEDLLKFTIALKKKSFFKKPDTWGALHGEPPGSNAQKQGGLGIAGGAPGINAAIETGIGKGYAAIVLSNYDPPAAERVMKKIRSIMSRAR